MTGKPAPNHIDNPEQYVPCKCPLCERCWRHFSLTGCIYSKDGPFVGWEET